MASRTDGDEGKLPSMSFWDHVDALRTLLLRMGGIVLLLMIVLFSVMKEIFDTVILAPCHADFITYRIIYDIASLLGHTPDASFMQFHVELINIQLASQFFIHMSTSFWLALIVSFPISIYFIWLFIKPALYPNERRGASKAFILGNVMFFLGVAVGYFLVFPLTLRFLAEYQVSTLVPNQISLDSYMDNFLIMIFIMGVIFEMPLLAWGLSQIGILRRNFFARYRRHAIVILLIAAAIITPTGDPFTLMVVFIPLMALYELSACFVKPKEPEKESD